MSWHYLQEGAVDFSLQNYLDSIPCAQLRLETTQELACNKGKEMEFSINSQCGMMYRHLTEIPGAARSTLSQEDSHVRTLAAQAKALELMEAAADYGRNIQESLGKLGLVLCSQKIPRCLGLEDWILSCQTLPRWGMTLDGACLELGTSAKFTSEIECGFLPTPSGVNGGVNHIAGRLDEWGRIIKPIPQDRDWKSALSTFRGMDDGMARDVGRTDGIRNGQVPIVAATAFRVLSAGLI
jgi:hypothetical protein